ncbi:hypothetical protein REPUB_Repub08aG0085500 [Reevesia pubescens]
MVMEIVLSAVLLFVGLAVLVVIHLCIVGRAFRRGYEDGSTIQIGSNRTKKMSDADLKKLPSFDYKAAEKGSSPVDCVVCLENFMKAFDAPDEIGLTVQSCFQRQGFLGTCEASTLLVLPRWKSNQTLSSSS